MRIDGRYEHFIRIGRGHDISMSVYLYLMRHGKAEAHTGDDSQRRLTVEGRATVGRVAERLAKARIRPDAIEHSGLVRARETAEIVSDKLGAASEPVAGLLPSSDVVAAARRLIARPERSVLVIGHLPFVERLASHLLISKADEGLLHLRAGAVAGLRNDDGRWTLDWFLAPSLT